MAKIRARQGKQQMEAKKPKKRGPTSTADARKTKSMDAVLGIEPINFSEDEGEGEKGVRSTQIASMADLFKPPLSPRSSLQAIQKQEEISRDFEYFLSANRDCAASIQQCNNTTLPILRSGTVVCNLENSFKNTATAAKVKITLDDIEDEIHFLSSSIVCYVLGANPPLYVLEGFIKRVWNRKVDKVGVGFYALNKTLYNLISYQYNEFEVIDVCMNSTC
ncbi:hypothetical protein CsatB_000880 [Cannabis sativa]